MTTQSFFAATLLMAVLAGGTSHGLLLGGGNIGSLVTGNESRGRRGGDIGKGLIAGGTDRTVVLASGGNIGSLMGGAEGHGRIGGQNGNG